MTSDVVKEAVSVTNTAVRESIYLAKKAWSLMDAASEKKQPTEYLSERAVRNIQGQESS